MLARKISARGTATDGAAKDGRFSANRIGSRKYARSQEIPGSPIYLKFSKMAVALNQKL